MMFAEFLKQKRLNAGLSQGAVAKKLGYTSPQFVSNWERGLSEPPIATLQVLASIYDIPVDEMFDIVLKTTIQNVTEELTKKFHGRNK